MRKKKIKNEDVIRNMFWKKQSSKHGQSWTPFPGFQEKKEATKKPNIMANIEHKIYSIFLTSKPLGK